MSTSRYSRQVAFPAIGKKGQARLQDSTVAVVGLGATGGSAAQFLARAGVGTLILIDRDVVEDSNLPRQILFNNQDADEARTKAEAAAGFLRAAGKGQKFIPRCADLNSNNVASLLGGAQLVMDGTDNFQTRYLLNDHCVAEDLPWIYMGAVGSWGMAGAVVPGGPCLRCTWPQPPESGKAPSCATEGILGATSSSMAACGSLEALKWLLGRPGDLLRGFVHLDVWSQEQRVLAARKDPDCPCCGRRDFPWLDGRAGGAEAEILCGGDSVQIPLMEGPLDLEKMAASLHEECQPLQQGRTLRFQSRNCQVILFEDGRALIRGTRNPSLAKSILAETFGI